MYSKAVSYIKKNANGLFFAFLQCSLNSKAEEHDRNNLNPLAVWLLSNDETYYLPVLIKYYFFAFLQCSQNSKAEEHDRNSLNPRAVWLLSKDETYYFFNKPKV